MRSEKKKIVITGTEDNFSALKQLIKGRGFEAVFFPTIEIKPARFVLKRKNYDWVIFTSRNAVEIFLKKTRKDFFKGKKIAAIGGATSALLARKGLGTDFTPVLSGSGNFIREFPAVFSIAGKRFLLPVSSKAGDTISSGLRAKGGLADRLIVYEAKMPRISLKAAWALMNKGPYDFILFSSPSAFGNFVGIKGLKTLLDTAHTAAIGPTTAAAMKKCGIKPDIIGKNASFRDMIEAIIKYEGGEK